MSFFLGHRSIGTYSHLGGRDGRDSATSSASITRRPPPAAMLPSVCHVSLERTLKRGDKVLVDNAG